MFLNHLPNDVLTRAIGMDTERHIMHDEKIMDDVFHGVPILRSRLRHRDSVTIAEFGGEYWFGCGGRTSGMRQGMGTSGLAEG